MRNQTEDSNRAFRELVRVLEEAVRAGANAIELEYEDRELIVYHHFGKTGVGASQIPDELQEAVIGELVKRAGLSRKSKGKMQVSLLGKDYEAVVKQHDSFGDPVFNLTLKEQSRKPGG